MEIIGESGEKKKCEQIVPRPSGERQRIPIATRAAIGVETVNAWTERRRDRLRITKIVRITYDRNREPLQL